MASYSVYDLVHLLVMTLCPLEGTGLSEFMSVYDGLLYWS